MNLEGSLETTIAEGTVLFEFAVENAGEDAVELQFSDAQTFDVTVREGGEDAWRFAEGMMFAQMLQTERLEPGEAVEYQCEWADPPAGDYEATAELTANNADCEATAGFSV